MRKIDYLWRNVFYGLFCFALFYEWMAPLTQLTDTGRIDIFLISFTIWLILDIIRIPVWIRVILKSLVIFIVIERTFFAGAGTPWSVMWVLDVWHDFNLSWYVFLSGDWMELSPLVRTTLFLIFVWITAGIMYRQVVRTRHLLWIWILTVIYVCVLDSLTPFDGGSSVVRLLGYGIVALSLSRLEQLSRQSKKVDNRHQANWLVFTGIFLVAVLTVGYSLPKYEASWEPLISLSLGRGSLADIGETKKVGYGDDDTRLGGGFVTDDTPVFVSRVTYPYYWRGEAKDMYDGSGWFHSEQTSEPMDPSTPIQPLFTQLNTDKIEQETSFVNRRYATLFTAGQLIAIDYEGIEPDVAFEMLVDESGWRTVNNEPLLEYRIETELPRINEQLLRETPVDYPKRIREKYLQLPKIPSRVEELARTIVQEDDHPYDQAKAIETFLKTSFVYETENVPSPPLNQDFVDHFLFELERGYCDHFSTAMVVMLRSNGIPARWVKGFAPGKRVYDSESNTYTVTVRNSDAHSWVEVYFEGIGWLPFEPTPSFVNPTPLERDRATEEEREAEVEEDLSEDEEHDEQFGDEGDTDSPIFNESRSPLSGKEFGVLLTVISVMLIGLVWGLMRVRGGSLHVFKRTPIGNRRTGHTRDAHRQLMNELERRFGKREPHQTMREYVMSIEEMGDTTRRTLIEWTKAYEARRYGTQTTYPDATEKLDYWWSKVWDELTT